MKHAIILGGGLSGLCAADKLLNFGFKVTILEKAGFLGGLASSFEQDGEHIPKYYHHIVSHNTTTQNYLNKYDAMGNNIWKKIRVAIGVNQKLSHINEPLGLLRFNYLTMWEKIRFGLFGLYTIFFMNPCKISDDENAQNWLTKFAGKGVTQKVFYNLYGRNKFNKPLSVVSAKQFAFRLKEREIYDKFTFPQKGIEPMIDGLEADILKKGGEIIKKCSVEQINLDKKEINTKTKKIKYDILLNTIPFPEFLKLAKELPEELSDKISQIKYCPCVGLVFATKEFLEPKTYWINLFGERVHVIMQHSVLIDKYSNKITWAIRYGGSEEDFELPDEKIKKEYLNSIKKYFPNLNPVWVKVFREKYAEPVYDKNYSSYMPKTRSGVEGLYFAGIQITFPKIRNMNTALESGIDAAQNIIEDYKS